LQENDIDDRGGHWLSCFPDSCTSLVSLNFACLNSEVNFEALERLVAKMYFPQEFEIESFGATRATPSAFDSCPTSGGFGHRFIPARATH
jgi:hypothetical protein